MFKRITTALLFGGLIGLVPTAAQAEPAVPVAVAQAASEPAAGYGVLHHNHDEDHYRCMYRCDPKRRYKHGYGHRHGYSYHRSYCWYYSEHRHRWYKTRCGRHYEHDYGHGYDH